MPVYVEIAVNVPQVKGVFHYHLPPELEGQVEPGHLVEVPFGARRVQGVVLRQVNEPAVKETKAVEVLVDPQPVLTPAQLALARELSVKSLAPLAACIDLMLPSGLSQQADTLYSLFDTSANIPIEKLSTLERRLVELLKTRASLRGRQIDAVIPRLNWRASAHSLVKKNILRTQSILPAPNVQPKSVRTVHLGCSPEEAEKALPDLGRKESEALNRRQAVLRFLMHTPGPIEATWVYAETGGNLADLHFLAERGLVMLGESEIWRDSLDQLEVIPMEAPPLLPDQVAAWDEIRKGLQSASVGQAPPPFLLHGVTGSGKTEVYMRAAEETMRQGRQVIILVPEIALTPQTVRRFMARYPGRVGLVHSSLSPGERYDTWRRARAGLISLVVGPRSALFTPFSNLGLIVVDEFHDDSYYQSESPPYYHAREASILYARLAGAVCLLGSATPNLTTRYRAIREGWRMLSLPARILGHRQVLEATARRILTGEAGQTSHYKPIGGQAETIDLPPVQIVDMRQELNAGNRSIFSRALLDNLKKTLEQDQQAILFLNRRGTSTYVFCRDCGFVLKCPRCDLPLTYHTARPQMGQAAGDHTPVAQNPASVPAQPWLVCHHCNYRRKTPASCPKCGSRRIRQFGAGTETVEAEVQAIFPEARTLRWDYDTTRQRGAHEIILSHFANHRADVLIGTQMIAKGLDLPLVTLVGVVLADVGLNLPDYRSAERTFQVLMQVAGRAGRSLLGGKVVLQTFQPDHYVITAAARYDYQAFYEKELDYRRQIEYPPFSRLVRLEYRHADRQHAEQEAQALAARLQTWIAQEDRRATSLIGPAPCYFGKVGGIFRWQIVVRGPDPVSLLRDRQLDDWRIEVDPISLL
jgi:primosomal protein N' (replication factor Y)